MTEPTAASQIWKKAEHKLPAIKHVDTANEIRHVLRYLASHAPDLYTGTPVPRKTVEEIVQLARALSDKAPGPCVQVRFSFLAAGFEIGNTECGWNVPLVPQLVRIKNPQNWATPANFTRRAAAGRLEQAFGRDLERPVSGNPAVYLGQLLFTAIFYGGLLERKWLEPFVAAVVKGDFFQYHGVLWVEMVRKTGVIPAETDGASEDSYYTKRFFPDNFTLALLYRLLDRCLVPAAIPGTNPWMLLQAYLKTLPGVSAFEQPANLDELLKLGLSRNLYLPGSMLAYATGKLKSTSLAIGPWLRCISRKAVRVAKPEEAAGQQKTGNAPKITVPRKCSIRRQEELFTRLLKEIDPVGEDLSRPETAKILDRFLITHKHELSPAFQLMILWGGQLLRPRVSYLERRSMKGAVKPVTVRRYFRAINIPFLMASADLNLTAIDQLELELIYEQTIIDRQKDAMAPRCMLQFHGFLQAFYGLPPIESVELKGNSAFATNQNANLITLDVYHLVLRGLGWGSGGMTRWQRLRVIAWIICYRCGLRPREVLNLRMIDFQLVGPAAFELLVRVSPKTERGRRRVPGSLRMSGEEATFILNYYHQRHKEIGFFGDNYLLAHPGQKAGSLADEDLYDPTRKLLRSITLDETLVPYHARHTYSSALQVQFQLRGRPLFNLDGFLDLDVFPENDREVRNALQGNELWGRKDQHVQAIMMGHSSPLVTNQYYNHLSDVLLGTLVRQRRDKVPISLKAMIQISGKRQSRASEFLVDGDDHPLTCLVKSQAKRFAERLLHPLLEQAVPMSLPRMAADRQSKLPPLEEIATMDLAQDLARGETNWDFAYMVYEGVRRLEGKRLHSATDIIRDINSQLENGGRRWRGPVYASIGDVRSVLSLLTDIGVPPDSVTLVHHPRRGQPVDVQAASLRLWQNRIDLAEGSWSVGEAANASEPKKGIIEIRVINPEARGNRVGKQPAMSRGFEIAIQLLKMSLTPQAS